MAYNADTVSITLMMRACVTTATRDISSEKCGGNVRYVVSGITKTNRAFKSLFSENLLGSFICAGNIY